MHMLMTLIYIKCISYDTDCVPLAKQVIYYQTQCNSSNESPYTHIVCSIRCKTSSTSMNTITV